MNVVTNFVFHKYQCLDDRLSATQDGLYSMKFVIIMQYTGIQILIFLTSPSNRWSMEITLCCTEEINFLGINVN
jgi:hypothetical protein